MKPLNELTDAELSECFAVEVAGYGQPFTAFAWHDRKNKSKPLRFCAVSPVKFELGDFGSFVREDGQKLSCGQPHGLFPIPPFSTSADAVLPWLEKLVNRRAFNDHSITVTGENYYINGSSGTLSKATTLARAACIALIEAKRRDGK